MLCNKRSHHNEKPVHHKEEWLHSPQLLHMRKPICSNKNPAQPKINLKKKRERERDTWNRNWQATPVFLPGKSPGQRSLVSSYRATVHGVTKNWDTT